MLTAVGPIPPYPSKGGLFAMLTAVGPIPQQRRIVRHAHCCGPHTLAMVDCFTSKTARVPIP